MTEPALAEMGHNNPPSDMEVFAQRMKETYNDTFAFAEKFLAAEDRMPEKVEDDITSGKLGDMIKQLKNCDKSLNAARTEEKELYLKGSRMVDGFFNSYREKLAKIILKAAEIQSVYLKKKEDEERRIREEKAEALRLETEAQLREAQRKAAEAEEMRKQQQAEAARVAKEAEDREKAIREQAEKDRQAAQAEIDRLKKEAEDAEKVDAETKRQLKEANERLKQVDKEERADIREVKSDIREAECAIAGMGAVAKAAQKESDKLLDTAARTEKQAEKMEKLADASGADMARTRGMEGSVSTIRTDWVGTLENRSVLDLEALRPHFCEDDLQFAIDQYVKANGGRQLKGVYVREETKAMVR